MTLLRGKAIGTTLLVTRTHVSLVFVHKALRILSGHPWCGLSTLYLSQHGLEFLLHFYTIDKISESFQEKLAVEDSIELKLS